MLYICNYIGRWVQQCLKRKYSVLALGASVHSHINFMDIIFHVNITTHEYEKKRNIYLNTTFHNMCLTMTEY